MDYDWKITILITTCLFYLGARIWHSLSVPKNSRCLHIIFITKNTKNIEQLLYWTKLCHSWDFFLGKGKVLLIDHSLDDEQKIIISNFLNRHPCFSICKYENISLELFKEKYNQIRFIF